MASLSHPATQGFYVFQTFLGSPLQFHPALGTSELDSLVDAYLPSPASVQDKRASISVDFLDHYWRTGESIKFYQVPDYWVGSTTSSPSSAQDSGYGSSFTASPMAPTWSWGPALSRTPASTPSASSSVSTPQIPSKRSRQSPSSRPPISSRTCTTDFSHLPGMKILTRDGQDVTNTATRGCKTKEQRDHAHLMRIMKACDSCKKKKVRCDPSHRTRASPSSSTELPSRQSKKPRVSAQLPKPTVSVPTLPPGLVDSESISALPDSFEFDAFDPVFLNQTPEEEQASWDEFLRLNGELGSVFSEPLDYRPDPEPLLEWSPNHPPVLPEYGTDSPPPAIVRPRDLPVLDVLRLPYLERNDNPHSYVDFNLYSPSSSFSDTEPIISGDLFVDAVTTPSLQQSSLPTDSLRPEGPLDTSGEAAGPTFNDTRPLGEQSPTSPLLYGIPGSGEDGGIFGEGYVMSSGGSYTLVDGSSSSTGPEVRRALQRCCSGAGYQVAPLLGERHADPVVESSLVHPATPPSSADEPSDSSPQSGAQKTMYRTTTSASLDMSQRRLGDRHSKFTANRPATTQQRTTPIATSPPESTLCMMIPTTLGTGQPDPVCRHITTGSSQFTAIQKRMAPTASSESSLGVAFVSAIFAAFTLATALYYMVMSFPRIDVFATYSSTMWILLCGVACILSSQDKEAEGHDTSAESLLARRNVAMIRAALNRILVLV